MHQWIWKMKCKEIKVRSFSDNFSFFRSKFKSLSLITSIIFLGSILNPRFSHLGYGFSSYWFFTFIETRSSTFDIDFIDLDIWFSISYWFSCNSNISFNLSVNVTFVLPSISDLRNLRIVLLSKPCKTSSIARYNVQMIISKNNNGNENKVYKIKLV